MQTGKMWLMFWKWIHWRWITIIFFLVKDGCGGRMVSYQGRWSRLLLINVYRNKLLHPATRVMPPPSPHLPLYFVKLQLTLSSYSTRTCFSTAIAFPFSFSLFDKTFNSTKPFLPQSILHLFCFKTVGHKSSWFFK